MMTKEEVMETVKAKDVRFIRIWFTDVLGFLKSFAITPPELEGAFDEGLGFDGSSIRGFTGIEESDVVAWPDPSTFQILPWRPKEHCVARMFADVTNPDGTPLEADPRYVLKKMTKKAAEMGYTFNIGPELEYFYFRDEASPQFVDKAGYFDQSTEALDIDIRRETVLALEGMGIQIEKSHHEVSPSQHEIDMHYADGLTMADWTITYKNVVKAIAQKFNVLATFMPKPIQGINGSGMHCHQSLFKGDTNAFGNLARMQGPMMGSAVPAFSESFNNGKIELCRYFIHNSLKYFGFITGFMAVSLAVLSSRIIEFLVIAFPDLQYYVLASVLVPSVIFVEAASPINGLADKIFNACHRPLTPIIIGYILTPLGYTMQFLFLWLCVFERMLPIWVLLIYPGFVVSCVRTVISFAWIQKSLIKIDYKRIAWQVIGAPVLAAVSYGLALFVISYTLWPALNGLFSTFIASVAGVQAGTQYGVLGGSLVVLFLTLFLFPGGLYAPFLSIFGGWDEFTLEEFHKCAQISGPSKGITMFVYNSFKLFARFSKLHNKFPMNDYAKVQKEAEELIAEGKANKILGKK